MKAKGLNRIKELLEEVATIGEIAEIERVIEEAREKVMIEPSLGFWQGKTPCWEMFHCPEEVKQECPAPKYRSFPCWEIEGTYCKRASSEDDTGICRFCRVYKKWGNSEPIGIRLFGKAPPGLKMAVEV